MLCAQDTNSITKVIEEPGKFILEVNRRAMIAVLKRWGFVNVFAVFSGFLTVITALDYIYKEYLHSGSQPSDTMIWAFSGALTFFCLFGILSYCLYAQGILQDEIDRMSKTKATLEAKILNNRRSSSAKQKPR